MKKNSVEFKYDRKTKKGHLIIGGKKVTINQNKSNICSQIGSGYGLHII